MLLLYCHLICPVSIGDLTNITEVIPENRTVSTSKRDLLKDLPLEAILNSCEMWVGLAWWRRR